MAQIKGYITEQFMTDSMLAVKVGLNMTDDSVKQTDAELEKEYSGDNVPVQLVDVTLESGMALVPNTAVVVPPGSSIQFDISYYCKLGFEYKIEISPNKIDIVNGLFVVRDKPLDNPEWLHSNIRRWQKTNNTIRIDDWHDWQTDLVPESAAKNSYIVTVTAYPVTSYENSDGDRKSIPVPHYATGALETGSPKVWKGNATKGMPVEGGKSSQTIGTIYDAKVDKNISNSLSFLLLVVEPTQFEQQFLVESLSVDGGLND